MQTPESPVVFITGAAKRIGARIARTFHERGYRVVIHYHHSKKQALALSEEFNRQRDNSAVAVQADLSCAPQVEALVSSVLTAYDRLDVLVNNASAFYPSPIADVDIDQWHDLMGSNLTGAFFLSQGLAEALREQSGAIVNIVDTHADRPLKDFSVYSIAKAGLKAMTKSLAQELSPTVRVNGVSPGAIMWPPRLEDDSDPLVLEAREDMLKKIALGRLGERDDIANVVYFLAVKAHYMTGQVIKVDGGRSLA